MRSSWALPTYVFLTTVVQGLIQDHMQIHPYAQMALSALTTASKVCVYRSLCPRFTHFWTADSVTSEPGCIHWGPHYQDQTNLRAHLRKQVTIEDQRKARCDSRSRPGHTGMHKVHRKLFGNHQLLYVNCPCIRHEDFIFSIGRRLGKNAVSETATKVANYNSTLDKLMQELRDQTLVDVQYNVQQIREDLSLDSLACAGRVGLNKEKQCLDGTRTEILKEVVDWMNNTDPTTPRIFWLHGQAGKGKSAIAHTIALQAENLGLLGSCFCFTRVRQHEGLHTKLFPTVARDLAGCEIGRAHV